MFSYDKIHTVAYVPVKMIDSHKIKPVSVVFVDDTTAAINYAKECPYRYIGQLLLVRNSNGIGPTVHEIINLDGDLKLIGTPMLDNDGAICLSYSLYLTGQFIYFDYELYFYNGIEFIPYRNDTCTNSQKMSRYHEINTSEDIIKAFDELQKRATELGMSIHCFRDDDYDLTLQYDDKTHRMLIATKIKLPIKDLRAEDVTV